MFGNFISESCTGTTGNLTLLGASYQRLAFSTKFSDTDSVHYVVEDANGVNKCGGVGTYNSGGTITRNDSWTWDGSTYEESPVGNLTLSGGNHTVRVTYLAGDVTNWFTHYTSTNNPHNTDLGNLGTGTLAELNALVTDATLLADMDWDDPVDGDIIPDAPFARSLGSDANRFVSGYFIALSATSLNLTGNIVTTGLVDGRDIAADGTQLDTNTSAVALNTAKISADGVISTHSDVDTAGATDGQILTWINGVSEWQPRDISMDWSDPVDAHIIPASDSAYTLGSSGAKFVTVHAYQANISGNIIVTGTVDGRDVAADGVILDSINITHAALVADIGYHDNVDTSGVTDGNVLTWVNANQAWEPVAPTSGGDSWGDLVDANIVPDSTFTRSIGQSGTEFVAGYFLALYTGSLQATGGVNLTAGDLTLDNGTITLAVGDVNLDNGDVSLDTGSVTAAAGFNVPHSTNGLRFTGIGSVFGISADTSGASKMIITAAGVDVMEFTGTGINTEVNMNINAGATVTGNLNVLSGSLTVFDNIIVTGTVDGVDVSALGASIGAHTDVDLTGLAGGDVLRYDNGKGQWGGDTLNLSDLDSCTATATGTAGQFLASSGSVWYGYTLPPFFRYFTATGATTIQADSLGDTFGFVAGTGIEYSTSGDNLTIGTVYTVQKHIADISPTQSILNTNVDVTFNTSSINGSDVSHSGTTSTINNDGTYRIMFRVRCITDNRAELFAQLKLNDTLMTDEIASNYAARDTDQNTGSVTLMTILELVDGDEIKYNASADTDGTFCTVTTGTQFTIERMI